MKKHFIVAALCFVAAAGAAQAQSFSASVNDKPRDRVERRTVTVSERPVGGAIPRGVRGGNPLQLLNPRAPRRYYGTPNDTVTYDQNNPSHITGIILFGFSW